MAVTTEIPKKYLYAMCYFAAMIISEQEEQYETQARMERKAYEKLAMANSVEDILPNSKRTTKQDYYG